MRILCMSQDLHGHFHSALNICQFFREAGHEIVFMIKPNWKPLLEHYGYKTIYYSVKGEDTTEDHQKKMGQLIYNSADNPGNKEDALYILEFFSDFLQNVDSQFESAINSIKPDLIVCVFQLYSSAIIKSNIPYICILPWNPLWIYEHYFPDKVKTLDSFLLKKCPKHINWLVSQGIDRKKAESVYSSSYLNVYTYCEELDYLEYGHLPDHYFRCDNAIRKSRSQSLSIDLSFLKPGEKLIFFTLGSMAGAKISLIQRILDILQKSKHKIVVSKGPFPDKITLYPNMVGDKFVDQIQILPKVDLVIAHGGNNSLNETLYYGKPMIILPVFADQPLNGQRIEEKGLGKCFDPMEVTEEQLLTAIDTILTNKEMKQKMDKISERLQSSQSGSQLVTLAENLVSLQKQMKLNVSSN